MSNWDTITDAQDQLSGSAATKMTLYLRARLRRVTSAVDSTLGNAVGSSLRAGSSDRSDRVVRITRYHGLGLPSVDRTIWSPTGGIICRSSDGASKMIAACSTIVGIVGAILNAVLQNSVRIVTASHSSRCDSICCGVLVSSIQAIVAQVLVAGVGASTDGSRRRVVAACFHDSRVVDLSL